MCIRDRVLELWLTVNGVEKQRSNTAKMLFQMDKLIADTSPGITLKPGDIITSESPEGVARKIGFGGGCGGGGG